MQQCHIRVDAKSGLVQTARGTSGNVHDVIKGNSLLNENKTDALGVAEYQAIEKRLVATVDIN
jgi:hypothetical protein